MLGGRGWRAARCFNPPKSHFCYSSYRQVSEYIRVSALLSGGHFYVSASFGIEECAGWRAKPGPGDRGTPPHPSSTEEGIRNKIASQTPSSKRSPRENREGQMRTDGAGPRIVGCVGGFSRVDATGLAEDPRKRNAWSRMTLGAQARRIRCMHA